MKASAWPAAARRGAAAAAVALLLTACSDPAPEQDLASASQYLQRDEPAAAAIAARNFLAARPDSAAGRLLLGRALMMAGDLEGAAAELQRAEALGHDAAETAPALAELWLAQQQPRKVLARFDGTVLPQPRAAADLLTSVASAQLELGQPDKARRALDAALQQLPGHEPANILSTRLAAERGDLAAAAQAAADLVARSAASADAWLLHGDLLVLQGDLDGAVASYRKALALRPRHAQAHIALVSALLRQGANDAAKAQLESMRKAVPNLPMVDYLDGLAALQRGDLERAREMTDRLARLAVPTAQTLMLGGAVQARQGQTEQAAQLVARAVEAAPQWLEARREMAALQLKLARPDRALDALKPVLADDPPDAALWALAGQTYTRLGDFRQADAAFARAAALRPGDAAVRASAARSQIARGKVELGLSELQAAAQADRDGIDTDLALVAAQMMRGNRAAAMQALDEAARKRPDAPLPPYLRGRALEQFGDRTGARAAYTQALAKDARFVQAIQALAALDLAEGKPDAARQRYESLARLDPKAAPAAWLALAELSLQGGAPPSEVGAGIDRALRNAPADAVLWRAALELQRRLGDPLATLARAQAANVALADDPALLLELAGAQLAVGEQRQAVATLRRATALRPQWAEAQLRLAVAHGLAGETTDAREPLDKALALAPDSPAVLRASIAMALDDKQPERARALARDVRKRQPRQPLGWELQAEIDNALGNTQAAAAAYRAALERGPSPERAVLLHRALRASDAAAARQFQAQWLKDHPADAFFIVHLAETAEAGGDAAEAEARYRQALRVQPGNPLVMNNLAQLLLPQHAAEALVLAQRAARQLPQVPAVLDTLAAAHSQSGQREQAVDVQQRAVALAPGDPTLRLHLAGHLAALGDKDQARAELRRALRTGLPNYKRDEAERLRRQLGA